MNKGLIRLFLCMMIAVLGLSVISFAQTDSKLDISKVDIKNFGQMDERFFRGGQPKKKQFKQLADLGINTVINLRDGERDFERETVESLGMKYINIPMNDNKYPSAEAIDKFMQIANDPATGKFFVHCKGGRHRAGAMGAVYRYNNYGWNYEQVFKEMKDFEFYTTFYGKFKVIKRFVKEYGEKKEIERKINNQSILVK